MVVPAAQKETPRNAHFPRKTLDQPISVLQHSLDPILVVAAAMELLKGVFQLRIIIQQSGLDVDAARFVKEIGRQKLIGPFHDGSKIFFSPFSFLIVFININTRRQFFEAVQRFGKFLPQRPSWSFPLRRSGLRFFLFFLPLRIDIGYVESSLSFLAQNFL